MKIERTGRTLGRREITLPLPDPAESAYLSACFPLSESEWAYLMHVLETMKPALVAPTPQAPDADG